MLLIIPWRGWAPPHLARPLDRREPLIFLFSKFSIAPIDGARAVRATGSNRFVGAAIERAGGLYVMLSLRHFGPAAMLLIIPSRVVGAAASARRCSTGASR